MPRFMSPNISTYRSRMIESVNVEMCPSVIDDPPMSDEVVDVNKPVTLTGAVTKVEWGNPHIWVYMDVKDERGVAQAWQCEGGAPNTLTRNGWSKDSLKTSEQITIYGYLAKDGSKTCNLRTVTLPDRVDSAQVSASFRRSGEPRGCC